MKHLKKKVVAITGAGSGIGRSIALAFAKEGCDLALSDIDDKGLAETARLVEDKAIKVTQHIVDVSDRAAMAQYASQVSEQHGGVNIIVNNAGVAISGTVEDAVLEDAEWLIGINFWGVVYGIREFLPYLRQADEGHIVVVSSLGGFSSAPNMGYYCASKYAVRAIIETVFVELKDSNIGVTGVHPGGTKTSLADNSRRGTSTDEEWRSRVEKINGLLSTSPDHVAAKIVTGVKKGKLRVITGRDARLLYGIHRLMPVSLIKLMRAFDFLHVD